MGVAGQAPAGASNRAQGSSPQGWHESGGVSQGGQNIGRGSNGGGGGGAAGVRRTNPSGAPANTGRSGSQTQGSSSNNAQQEHMQRQQQQQQQHRQKPSSAQSQGQGMRGPAESARLSGAGGAGESRHSAPAAAHGKQTTKKIESQALYVPKRSARGPSGENSAVALPANATAVPTAGS